MFIIGKNIIIFCYLMLSENFVWQVCFIHHLIERIFFENSQQITFQFVLKLISLFALFTQNQYDLDKIFKKIKIYMIWYINQNHVIMLITWHWPQLCWCKSGGKRWPRFNWSAAEQALLEVKRCSKKIEKG